MARSFPSTRAVSLTDMSPALKASDLCVGMVLAYKGDRVPFLQAKHLISKGQKAGGLYLLPAYDGAKWSDVPGIVTDEYRIIEIEKERVSKRGADLPDMIWITGSSYRTVKFGLNPIDVVAKFSLVMSPEEVGIITTESHGIVHDMRNAWEEKLKHEGW